MPSAFAAHRHAPVGGDAGGSGTFAKPGPAARTQPRLHRSENLLHVLLTLLGLRTSADARGLVQARAVRHTGRRHSFPMVSSPPDAILR